MQRFDVSPGFIPRRPYVTNLAVLLYAFIIDNRSFTTLWMPTLSTGELCASGVRHVRADIQLK